ncbi:MAG: winged helix-turn-helix transcriptional regulator [Euryarchaeota archaeon]|nr:winged helix-turn-helix transcriptional regulator [Euryarchaeota archaeon]
MGELSTRRRIYEEIVMNPGLHFRELQKRLNMPTGMLEYHIRVLEREGVIVSKADGKYKRLFANTTMTREERKMMSALRGEVDRKIIIYLLEHGKSKHSDVAQDTGIKVSTLSYHMKKLVKNGILGREEVGRESYYYVLNPDRVAATLIKYRRSFLDSLVDNFAKWYMSEREQVK